MKEIDKLMYQNQVAAEKLRMAYGKAQYNQAINDAIAAIDRMWDLEEYFSSSLHIKIENELDKLKKS